MLNPRVIFFMLQKKSGNAEAYCHSSAFFHLVSQTLPSAGAWLTSILHLCTHQGCGASRCTSQVSTFPGSFPVSHGQSHKESLVPSALWLRDCGKISSAPWASISILAKQFVMFEDSWLSEGKISEELLKLSWTVAVAQLANLYLQMPACHVSTSSTPSCSTPNPTPAISWGSKG